MIVKLGNPSRPGNVATIIKQRGMEDGRNERGGSAVRLTIRSDCRAG